MYTEGSFVYLICGFLFLWNRKQVQSDPDFNFGALLQSLHVASIYDVMCSVYSTMVWRFLNIEKNGFIYKISFALRRTNSKAT